MRCCVIRVRRTPRGCWRRCRGLLASRVCPLGRRGTRRSESLVSIGIEWPWRASFELDAGLAADCCKRAAGEIAEPMGFGCRVLKRRARRAKNLL